MPGFVSILLHMNGTNLSTSFIDSSTNNFTITNNGNPVITTSQFKYGGASGSFNGSSSLVVPPQITKFNANQDFTIETWAYLNNYDNTGIIGTYDFGKLVLAVYNEGTFNISRANVAGICESASGAVSLNVWHHLAATRKGEDIKLFVDGIIVAEGADSGEFEEPNNLEIGHFADETSWWWDGYLDDFRITKGEALYTSDFTPPSSQFPDP